MPQTLTARSPLLSVEAVAKRLGVPKRFIYRLVEERRLPHTKLGRYLRFEPADVEAYIEAGRREAVAR
jgi:excisionase family DNA binding protein